MPLSNNKNFLINTVTNFTIIIKISFRSCCGSFKISSDGELKFSRMLHGHLVPVFRFIVLTLIKVNLCLCIYITYITYAYVLQQH